MWTSPPLAKLEVDLRQITFICRSCLIRSQTLKKEIREELLWPLESLGAGTQVTSVPRATPYIQPQ